MVGPQIIIRRANASSLLEVVVAMVLIAVVFGIAMMIVANVTRASASIEQVQARAVLNDVLLKAEATGEMFDRTFMTDSLIIEEYITPHSTPGLSVVHLTAYSIQQRKLAELRKIVITNK